MSTEEQLSQIKGFDNVKNFYEGNKKNINMAGAIVLVLFAAVYYYFRFHLPSQEREAQAQLFTAERYIREDSLDLALNGDGYYLGTKQVADDFGRTKAGNLAAFYSGSILLRKGEFNEALKYLEDCSFDDQIHAASRLTLVGDCYSELGDYKKAGSSYMKAAEKRENSITTPAALMKAAYAFEAAGEFDKAIDALQELKNEYPDAQQTRVADKLMGKFEAEKASK